MSETKRPHGSRFRDALVIINPGACNPSGAALSIADACREIREHEKADMRVVQIIRLVPGSEGGSRPTADPQPSPWEPLFLPEGV